MFSSRHALARLIEKASMQGMLRGYNGCKLTLAGLR
jgi:hypothetical protein